MTAYPKRRWKQPDKRMEAAVRMRAAGWSLRKIAGDLGVNEITVRRDLARWVIDERMWRVRVDPASGREFKCRSFDEFVRKRAADGGLGSTAGQLYRLCPDLTDKLDQAFGRKRRSDMITGNVDIINNSGDLDRPAGTSERAAHRKLRKDAPELHAEVLAGRLSAHAAMVRAGFRPKTITVPIARPDAIARSLRRYMSADDATSSSSGTPDVASNVAPEERE